MKQQKFQIVSYPRSGNHLVRTVIEACFERATLGCYGSGRDIPIADRLPNKSAGLIQLKTAIPVGCKSHNSLGCMQY